MSKVVPKRSTGGCLTCKRRKKKCDERRPHCRRCEQGDFHCQGYGPPDVGYADATQASLVHWPLFLPQNGLHSSSSLESLDSLIPLSDSKDETRPPTQAHILLHEVNNCLSSVPNNIRLDPIVLEDATLLIVSQYLRFSRELLFKRPSSSMEQGLLWRMDDSEITRWSMYLSARVMKDLSSGNNGWKYMDWIFRFCQQILETPPTTRQEPNLGGRFGGLLDLVNLVFMVSGATAGYSLFKRCAPEFLQLASLSPNLWYNDSTISIPEAIKNPRYEITQFVIYDTIIALVLGTPPLIHYNTTPSWIVGVSYHYQIMYGFPLGILLLLAKANAWRTSRLVGQAEQDRSDWRELEEHLNSWHPTLDHSDGPNNSIARLAVQEAWRQAAVIYLYMGMKEVNSADPRVEKAIQQIVQLGGTFETGHPFELHLMIPCLIAGVAARQEKHRSALRTKLVSAASRRVNMFILCGSDLITILDHLWHGAGSEGRPIIWDDYVQSRCAVLPAL